MLLIKSRHMDWEQQIAIQVATRKMLRIVACHSTAKGAWLPSSSDAKS